VLTDTHKAIRVIAVIVLIVTSYAFVKAWLVDHDQHQMVVNGIALVVNLVIIGGLWEFQNWARIWLLIRFAVTGVMMARFPTPSNLAMITFFVVAGYYLCRRDVVAEFERRSYGVRPPDSYPR
jgi:hypothetical protein